MKKRFILITAVIGLLVSCPNPSDNQDNPDNQGNPDKTFIVFDNTNGICAVSVYDSNQRREQDKIAEVPAGQDSAEIAWTPGVSVPFYFSYTIKLKGVSDFTLNYVPEELGKGQQAVRIDSGRKTTIPIPVLNGIVSSFDVLLSTRSYLLIQNESSFPFSLHSGTVPVPRDNESALSVNKGEQGQYTINPGGASQYRLLVGADYYPFPVTAFEAGRVYYFVFDANTVTLNSKIEVTLENIVRLSPLSELTPGLYCGMEKIGAQNLADSLAYISENAVSGDHFQIVLGANESVSPKILYYLGKTVVITLLGYDGERTIRLNRNGTMFEIKSGITLVLDENITLRGRNGNEDPLVLISSGNMVMNTGARITDNGGDGVVNQRNFIMNGGKITDNGCRGVYNNKGTFTMNGGGITNNGGSINNGCGVHNEGGTFTMKNGEISGNINANSFILFGGGGGVINSGNFTMTGGKIFDNEVINKYPADYLNGGGGVFNSGIFSMNGGEITGNTTVYFSFEGLISGSLDFLSGGGGGVYNIGIFTMKGGKISGNTATHGGGVFNTEFFTEGTFTMNGGEITGNTASDNGGGVYGNGGIFTKSGGGTITGYISDTVNGNVVKNSSGVMNNQGHAVYTDRLLIYRETTAGPGDNLDSSKDGAAGGWVNIDYTVISPAANTWVDGNIDIPAGQQLFKFTATDSTQGIHVSFGTLTSLYAQVYDSSGNTVGSQANLSSSSTRDISRTVKSGQEYYIRIRPYDSSGSGTYKIALNTTLNPPGTTITTLTANTWADGNITSGGEQWFKFTATNYTTQYIHVNTLTDLYVHMYASDGTAVGSRANLNRYTRYDSRGVTQGQEYYIKIWPCDSSDSGTYKIAINMSSTSP